jgi:hypothetical protein
MNDHHEPLEAWRRVWREGFAPQFSDRELRALLAALWTDAADLIQGATCEPPPLHANGHRAVCGACLIAYGPWKAAGLATVDDLERRFADLCYEADRLLGEPQAVRYLFDHWDTRPRMVVRCQLMAEIAVELFPRTLKTPA